MAWCAVAFFCGLDEHSITNGARGRELGLDTGASRKTREEEGESSEQETAIAILVPLPQSQDSTLD